MSEQPTTTTTDQNAADVAAAQAVLAAAGVPVAAPPTVPTAEQIAAAQAVLAAATPAPEPVAPLTVHELIRILGDRVFAGDERVMFADAVTASAAS